MVFGVIRTLVAVLLALAIILVQLFYGGLMRTVFSLSLIHISEPTRPY